jgi:hypothetical protein
MSPAAVFRYCAAPAESLSSRRSKSKRLGYPSSTHLRSRSKPARAMRNSARATCSRRRRSARWTVASRAVVITHRLMRLAGLLERTHWRAGATARATLAHPSDGFAARERGLRRRRAGPPGAVGKWGARSGRKSVKLPGGLRQSGVTISKRAPPRIPRRRPPPRPRRWPWSHPPARPPAHPPARPPARPHARAPARTPARTHAGTPACADRTDARTHAAPRPDPHAVPSLRRSRSPRCPRHVAVLRRPPRSAALPTTPAAQAGAAPLLPQPRNSRGT